MTKHRDACAGRYRQLMAAGTFVLIVHALGLVSMGAWPLPGFDPDRSIYVSKSQPSGSRTMRREVPPVDDAPHTTHQSRSANG